MMRELKFRAWFSDVCEMTKPWTIYDVSKKSDPNFDFVRKEPFLSGTGGNAVGGIFLSSERPHTIMQYIGFKDLACWKSLKVGKDVFEGDIIRSFNKKSFGKIMVVESKMYFNCCFSVTYGWDIPCEEMEIDGIYVIKGEVIGNIYENKDLLNEGA